MLYFPVDNFLNENLFVSVVSGVVIILSLVGYYCYYNGYFII